MKRSLNKIILCLSAAAAAVSVNAEPVQAVLFEGDYGGNRNSALGNAPDEFHFFEEGDFNGDSSTDSRRYIPILFPYPGIGEGQGPVGLNFQIDQDLFGVSGFFYTGAQIVAYSPTPGFFPSFGLYRWGSGPQAMQITSGNATPTDDMGYLGTFFAIKEDFLNGADEIADLRLPNQENGFSAEVFFRGKPKTGADPAGIRRARFIVQAGDGWYVSETGTADDPAEPERDQTRTLSSNPAADYWYEYNEQAMLFVEEDANGNPVGTAVRGDTLLDITAVGVIMQNTRFDGTIEGHYVWLNWNEFSMHLDPDPTPVVDDPWVDTGDWLGWIYNEHAPWVYSSSFDKYIYLPDEGTDANGGWAFVPAPQ